MRNSLGEVDEDDISAYVHNVADSMEEFLPLTEDEINSIELKISLIFSWLLFWMLSF